MMQGTLPKNRRLRLPHAAYVWRRHNLVENAIRPTKLGSKNWLFIGNEASGQKCAILYTIVENCRRLGINPKEYLIDVLSRLPAMLAKDVVTLTPANWLKARSGKPTRMAA
jgi:transposase